MQTRYARFQRLAVAMAERGVEVRGDSRLCNEYINAGCWRSVEDIVDIMEEMAWLHRHDAEVGYTARRESCFGRMFREAKEYDGWVPHEEMEDMGHNASESAKHAVATKLVRDEDLLEKVAPLPQAMQRRVAALKKQMQDEARELEKRTRMATDGQAPQTLMEIALAGMRLSDLGKVPDCILHRASQDWAAKRLKVGKSLLWKARQKKAVADMSTAIQDGVYAAVAAKCASAGDSDEWVSVGSYHAKDSYAIRSAIGMLGMQVRVSSPKKGKVVHFALRCSRDPPFEQLGEDDTQMKRLVQKA